MSFLAKFNAGKRLNLTQRGSFETRAHISGLKYNEGLKWQMDPWEHLMEDSPGKNFEKFLNERLHNQETTATRRLELNEQGHKPTKRKNTGNVRPSKSYGPNALQAPLSEAEFLSEKNRILKNMQVCNLISTFHFKTKPLFTS